MLYNHIDCWLIIKLSSFQLIATSALWANDSLNFLLANATNIFYNMVTLSGCQGRHEAGGSWIGAGEDGGRWQYQDKSEVRGMARVITVPRQSRGEGHGEAMTVPRQSWGEGHGEGDDRTRTESRWGAWRGRWKYQDRIEVRGFWIFSLSLGQHGFDSKWVSDRKQALLKHVQVWISFRATCPQQYREFSDPKSENKRCCCARVHTCPGLAVFLFPLSFGLVFDRKMGRTQKSGARPEIWGTVQKYCTICSAWPGYAVLVEKVGLFLEKVGLFWKKPYFFSDGQVLVVWRKSRAFSKKALLFPKLPGFLIIRGIPSII